MTTIDNNVKIGLGVAIPVLGGCLWIASSLSSLEVYVVGNQAGLQHNTGQLERIEAMVLDIATDGLPEVQATLAGHEARIKILETRALRTDE